MALFFRYINIPTWQSIKQHYVAFLPIIVFFLGIMYLGHFYVLERPQPSFKRNIFLAMIALLAMCFGFSEFYLFFNNAPFRPMTILAINSLISFILIAMWRDFYDVIVLKFLHRPNLVFIGFNATVADLLELNKTKSYFGYSPLACFTTKEKVSVPIKILKTATELESFFERNKVDIMVLSTTKPNDPNIRRFLFSKLNENICIYTIQDFYEMSARKIPLDVLNDAWILSHIDLKSKKPYLFIKRVADIIISFITLILLSPLLLIVAILVKLTSEGPMFFKQVREGKNGKPFPVYKFRTMKIEDNNFQPTAEHDSRITSIGAFLRKTRIDEIPQMFNVLKGDMSIVGPRPERPELAVELAENIPFYKQRLLVKPGITGWDQVSGEYHSPSVEDTIKKIKFDLYYIKNLSWFLDISILFKTVTAVFSRSGR